MGAPTSLLNEARAATVGPTRSSIARSRFLVVVLPFDPVTPTMRSLPSARTRRTTSVARAPSASTESATTTWGTRELECMLDDEQGGTLLGRRRGEAVPVVELAALGDEDAARRSTSRESVVTVPSTMRLRCGIRALEVQRAARGRRDLGQGEGDHRATPHRAAPARVVPWPNTGSFTPRDLVVVLVAGAGVEDRVAFVGEGERRRGTPRAGRRPRGSRGRAPPRARPR